MSTVPTLPSAPSTPAVAISPRVGGARLPSRTGSAPAGLDVPLRLAVLGLLLAATVFGILVNAGKLNVRTLRLPWMTPSVRPELARSAESNGGSNATTRADSLRPEPARSAEPKREPRGHADVRPASTRVVSPTHATALFKEHSWYVPPPPPPALPPPPPPEPTAPPLPFTFVGSYAPDGEKPVYFLAHGDRVIDAHVGDQLDGVYQFESVNGELLVFKYLPLNIRQNLAPAQNPTPKGTR